MQLGNANVGAIHLHKNKEQTTVDNNHLSNSSQHSSLDYLYQAISLIETKQQQQPLSNGVRLGDSVPALLPHQHLASLNHSTSNGLNFAHESNKYMMNHLENYYYDQQNMLNQRKMKPDFSQMNMFCHNNVSYNCDSLLNSNYNKFHQQQRQPQQQSSTPVMQHHMPIKPVPASRLEKAKQLARQEQHQQQQQQQSTTKIRKNTHLDRPLSSTSSSPMSSSSTKSPSPLLYPSSPTYYSSPPNVNNHAAHHVIPMRFAGPPMNTGDQVTIRLQQPQSVNCHMPMSFFPPPPPHMPPLPTAASSDQFYLQNLIAALYTLAGCHHQQQLKQKQQQFHHFNNSNQPIVYSISPIVSNNNYSTVKQQNSHQSQDLSNDGKHEVPLKFVETKKCNNKIVTNNTSLSSNEIDKKVEEHFKRSLGKKYFKLFSDATTTNSPCKKSNKNEKTSGNGGKLKKLKNKTNKKKLFKIGSLLKINKKLVKNDSNNGGEKSSSSSYSNSSIFNTSNHYSNVNSPNSNISNSNEFK